jgi:glycosyltransferase involved in cell wall biosynthesis
MQIHHIINSYSLGAGGAERLVRSMHITMQKRGIESAIFGLLAHNDKNIGAAKSLGLESPYSLRAIWGVLIYVRENVESGDIVHAHLFPANLYVSILKQAGLIKVPVVTTEHSTSNSRRNTLLGKIIDAVLYRGYDRIYAISDGVKRELLRWKPSLKERVITVQNGVRLLHNEFYVRADKYVPVILSIGGLRQPKNHKTMLSAVALLSDLGFEYWIAGDGKDRAALEEFAQRLGISTKISFLGHVDDVKPLLRQADIFLMASRWEGFGLAAVEAMNASLPVVGSNVEGLKEVIHSEPPCAILVDPDSALSISEALRELLISSEKRIQLGKMGFERAKLFSDEHMIERYLEEYEKLLGHY